jgi:glycosyltransferase involved in cell wall biosynthesis
MKKPFITVITCTFNSAKYLEKNILSVKNQTLDCFEHVFIDGNSTDGTLDMIKKYQLEFPSKVRIFQFEPRGISNAMNHGVMNSFGEYIIHLHSDDSFYDKDVLSDAFNFLNSRNKPDWIYGKICTLEGTIVKGVFPSKNIWQNINNNSIKSYLLKLYNYVPHQAVYIRKEVFNNFGFFDENLKYGMDPDLWLRIRSKTRWLFFDRIISNYVLRPDAQSSGYKYKIQNEKDALLVQKRYLNSFEFVLFKLVRLLLKLKKSNYQK